MKSMILRSSVALACALSLAACGGGSGNLLLGGSIIGLHKDGLVLQNKGGDPLTISSGQTTFAFSKLLSNDEDYEVTVRTQPTGAKCVPDPATNKGRTGAFNVTSVVVHCQTDYYTLGGHVDHLDAEGLVLVNGADSLAVPANATSFTFGTAVFNGDSYGVTVLRQPTGRTCEVTNGSGKMGDAKVDNVQVSCHP